MDKQFLMKLRGTLDALINQNKSLASRLAAVEHSVNDVIIGGLTSAAEEYEDNERFSEFVDSYQDAYSPLGDACKIIYGDDYDLAEELYNGSKGQEDVKSYVEAEIQALQSKLDSLRAMKNGNDSKEEIIVEESSEPVSEDELDRIAKLVTKGEIE